VWVYNSQNATPDIQAINALCKQHHIPVATVTETLAPPIAQLRAVAGRAVACADPRVARATGR
jgi:hypothetical protein